jgi:cytochrome c-type biogenesis protein CcmH/NrfG
LQSLRPLDRDLASQAVKLYPQNSAAWFWLGEASFTEEKAISRQAYQQATTLNPKDSVAWCRLGSIYENANELDLALKALTACCRLGDPGRNGCWGAGRVYEKLGDLPAAIATYRRSIWSTALQRADELEKQLKP